MNLLFEILEYVFFFFYYVLEAIVLAFVPVKYKKKDVRGQKVLVTGAGSGLGRSIAVRFARLQCTLVLWDINKDGLEETKSILKISGMPVYTYVCDLSDREAIYKTADKTKSEVGDIDILVNNAGIVTGKRYLDCPDTLIEKTMAVNVNAHFWTVKAFLPKMMENNMGHIVNIASSAGLFGVNGLADYCASKFAAVGFHETLHTEVVASGKDGVKCTVVCPYYINTGMFEGVKTKFPALLPIIEQEDAVDRIMNAVLCNKTEVLMPESVYIFYAIKGILPSKVNDISQKFFGINNCMDDFKGREKRD